MNIKKYTSKYENLAKNFKCGNIVIDNFLKDGRALDENQGITYILLSDEEDRIVGYYNIEVGRVDQIETVGENRYFIPMGGSVNINYLAVDQEFRGTQIAEIGEKKIYIGDYLLRHCEGKILELRKQVGISFVTLYSTEQGYHLYHERNEYEDFEKDMSTFIKESDRGCYQLYKWVDDLVDIKAAG